MTSLALALAAAMPGVFLHIPPDKSTPPRPVNVSHVADALECCGACIAFVGCRGADFRPGTPMRSTWDGLAQGGSCHLKGAFSPRASTPGAIAIKLPLI